MKHPTFTKTPVFWFLLLGGLLGIQSCSFFMDQTVEEALPMEEARMTATLQGAFRDADRLHRGTGTATIFRLPNQDLLLRFEDFKVTNGPALRVWMVKHPNPANRANLEEGYRDLGPLKGNIGNQNYKIPFRTDLSEFKNIVIYCETYDVIFSIASLSEI